MAQHIIVTEYNPLWADMLETEATKITAVFGKNCSAVHHIGSTAVAGLAVKLIIYIVPIIHSLKDVDKVAPEFEKIGYEYSIWANLEYQADSICVKVVTSEPTKFIFFP